LSTWRTPKEARPRRGQYLQVLRRRTRTTTSCWGYAVRYRRLNTLGLHQLAVEEIPQTDPKILKFLKELNLEGLL